MFIVKTTTGEKIQIDFDELEKIAKAPLDSMLWFRRGAVLKRLIGLVVEDTERRKDVLKIFGESEQDRKKKIETEKSEDLFKDIRNKPTVT